MPRPNPLRLIQSEASLAKRIAYEREKRGWTYEGLAKRMADVGCPIQGSAIYKIEKGDPPRRISVDELVALTMVFDIETENLLLPAEEFFEGEAAHLSAEVLIALTEHHIAVERLIIASRNVRLAIDTGALGNKVSEYTRAAGEAMAQLSQKMRAIEEGKTASAPQQEGVNIMGPEISDLVDQIDSLANRRGLELAETVKGPLEPSIGITHGSAHGTVHWSGSARGRKPPTSSGDLTEEQVKRLTQDTEELLSGDHQAQT